MLCKTYNQVKVTCSPGIIYFSLNHYHIWGWFYFWWPGESPEHDATEALWSIPTCPLEGRSLYQVQLNIDANNAGSVLPLPCYRGGVASSVERAAVWWIGFSWSSECRILPPVEVRDSAAKSCCRIRLCSLLSALSTYCNIFSQIFGENQGSEEEERIYSSSLSWSLYLLHLLLFMLSQHFSSLSICESVF